MEADEGNREEADEGKDRIVGDGEVEKLGFGVFEVGVLVRMYEEGEIECTVVDIMKLG